MTDHPADRATRRRFIAASAAVLGSAAVPPSTSAAAGRFRPEGRLDAQDPPANADAGDAGDPDAITVDTFAEAEKLAGITFSPEEREMLARSIGEQVRMFEARRGRPFAPNDLAPALTFDPRLPGRPVDLPGGPLRYSAPDPGPLPNDDRDIAFAPLTRLCEWIRRRRITSVALTRLYLDRLKHFDEQLNCVVTLTEDRALRHAARADQEIAAGQWRGPLHGIPWGAKDLLDTAGIRTTWGAEPHVDRVPDRDAAVVRRLDEAGAVLVAKLTLGALAYGDIWFGGRTNNPWNVERGSSGSSAGPAAAVAAGLVGFAIGTETYGSIVSPSMACGTTGLRPTFGRVARDGAMALCWSLDKIGPMTRRVDDALLVLNAINGAGLGDETDPSLIDLPLRIDHNRGATDMRVGWHPSWFEGRGVHANDQAALDHLRDLGVEVVEIDLPDWPYQSLLTILYAEAAASFEELTRSNHDDALRWQAPQAWPNTFRRTWFIPATELVQADRFRREVMQMMAERFENIDAIIAPSFAASLLIITNNTGHPAMTIRTGLRDQGRNAGMPHGITLIGRLFDEGTLVTLGRALEAKFDAWHLRPPVS